MIKLVAFDVDGVMTDGSITYDNNGVEYKTFNAKDGHGLVSLHNSGVKTAIITARNSQAVTKRAEDLKIDEVHQGVKNKLETLDEILNKYGLEYSEVAYMGDDIPDICVLEKVEIAGCPADAVEEVKDLVNFQASKNGGCGAVREFCECILKQNQN